jgi:hypothetical protein
VPYPTRFSLLDAFPQSRSRRLILARSYGVATCRRAVHVRLGSRPCLALHSPSAALADNGNQAHGRLLAHRTLQRSGAKPRPVSAGAGIYRANYTSFGGPL